MTSYTPIRQAYDVFNPENGENKTLMPIIFIHGVFSCKESWLDLPQTVANKTKRKVYSMDIRNHGDSDWTEEFDCEILTKDILHFMETINSPKATIVSHSLGGRIAIKLALEHAEKVEKLIVEEMIRRKLDPKIGDTIISFTKKGPEALGIIPKGIEESVAAGIVLNYIYDIHPQEKEEPTKACPHSIGLIKTETGEYKFKANMEVLTTAAKNISSFLTVSEGCFDGPTCFVYGKDSPYRIDTEIDDLKKYFPKAEFVGIDGANHNVHQEKMEEFSDAVLKFLLK